MLDCAESEKEYGFSVAKNCDGFEQVVLYPRKTVFVAQKKGNTLKSFEYYVFLKFIETFSVVDCAQFSHSIRQ